MSSFPAPKLLPIFNSSDYPQEANGNQGYQGNIGYQGNDGEATYRGYQGYYGFQGYQGSINSETLSSTTGTYQGLNSSSTSNYNLTSITISSGTWLLYAYIPLTCAGGTFSINGIRYGFSDDAVDLTIQGGLTTLNGFRDSTYTLLSTVENTFPVLQCSQIFIASATTTVYLLLGAEFSYTGGGLATRPETTLSAIKIS